MLNTRDVVVLFEGPIENVAKEVAEVYPAVRAELVTTLGWEVDFRPGVRLVKGRDALQRMVGSDIVIGFAIPERNLIVLDISRVYAKPFSLEALLKHELCHLLLHRYIEKERLPRWLDEGVCQWASGGITELMALDGDPTLAKATLSDRLIRIENLERFPKDRQSLLLAYEESKSLVDYIVREFGKTGLLRVLEHLREGHSLDDSLLKGLSVTTDELEMKWRAYLKRKHTWFSYVRRNLYVILFFLAALVTVYGFVRMLKKKRAYVDEAEEEDID